MLKDDKQENTMLMKVNDAICYFHDLIASHPTSTLSPNITPLWYLFKPSATSNVLVSSE